MYEESPRHHRYLKKEFLMSEPVEITSENGQMIRALHDVPGGPKARERSKTLILFSHGFPGDMSHHEDLFGLLSSLLVGAGFHTLRFDYRGCGKSDGRPEHFTLGSANEDFKTVTNWAEKQGYKHIIYIGEGLGATLCLMNLDLNVRALVLFWPIFNTNNYYEHTFAGPEIRIGFDDERTIEHKDHKISAYYLHELKKTDISYAMKEVVMPTLIMHGAKDKDVPMSQLDTARSQLASKRIEITTFHDGEAGLSKPNHRKVLSYHVMQFIEKYT